MAKDRDIAQLEREIEQARARVVADIAKLRAPETMASARKSVVNSVYGYRDDAMEAAQGRATSFIDALKAKAAANPAAAAAILAGLAWRVYRHPPIASLLIGAGVAALARTDPDDDSLTLRRLAQRAAESARDLKERAAVQIAELTVGAAGGAQEKVYEWSAVAGRAFESLVHRRISDGESETLEADAASGARSGPSSLHDDFASKPCSPERFMLGERQQRQKRDAYLLGFAALALGAAIGAARRREFVRRVEEYV